MQMRRISTRHEFGRPQFASTVYPLPGLDLQLAKVRIETFTPTMFELDVAPKSARLIADFYNTSRIDGQDGTARRQQEVQPWMPLERHPVVCQLRMDFRIVTPTLEQYHVAFKGKREVDAFRLILIGELNITFGTVTHWDS